MTAEQRMKLMREILDITGVHLPDGGAHTIYQHMKEAMRDQRNACAKAYTEIMANDIYAGCPSSDIVREAILNAKVAEVE